MKLRCLLSFWTKGWVKVGPVSLAEGLALKGHKVRVRRPVPAQRRSRNS